MKKLYKILLAEYESTDEQYIGNALTDCLEKGLLTKEQYDLILNDCYWQYNTKEEGINFLKTLIKYGQAYESISK